MDIENWYVNEAEYSGLVSSDKAKVQEMKSYIGNKFMKETGLVMLTVSNLVVNKIPYGCLFNKSPDFDPKMINFERHTTVWGYPSDVLPAKTSSQIPKVIHIVGSSPVKGDDSPS